MCGRFLQFKDIDVGAALVVPSVTIADDVESERDLYLVLSILA